MATGKRAGSRRAKPARRFDAKALKYAVGITLCLIAWGYLVYMAIDFGATARSGDGASWALLALASLGAVACLFVALVLATGLVKSLGSSAAEPDGDSDAPTSARAPGGRRAAR